LNSSKNSIDTKKDHRYLSSDVYFHIYASFAVMIIFFLVGLIIFLIAQINRVVCKKKRDACKNKYEKKLKMFGRLKRFVINLDLNRFWKILDHKRKPECLPRVNDERLEDSFEKLKYRNGKIDVRSSREFLGMNRKSINKIRLNTRVIFLFY